MGELRRRVVERRPVVLVHEVDVTTAADQKPQTFGAPEKKLKDEFFQSLLQPLERKTIIFGSNQH